MNTSFDPLNLVNTYGAFGSVGQERYNIVFEGTMTTSPPIPPTGKNIPTKVSPPSPDQRPAQVAPYHLRFDWQMWFAAMSTPDEYPWTLTLISKLLHNDPEPLASLPPTPFQTNLPAISAQSCIAIHSRRPATPATIIGPASQSARPGSPQWPWTIPASSNISAPQAPHHNPPQAPHPSAPSPSTSHTAPPEK